LRAISNVLAAPVTEPEEIRKLLVAQVTGAVRWRESMAFMAGKGISVSNAAPESPVGAR
jgi:[acyl-carrier-protein] S-malonyltransferase